MGGGLSHRRSSRAVLRLASQATDGAAGAAGSAVSWHASRTTRPVTGPVVRLAYQFAGGQEPAGPLVRLAYHTAAGRGSAGPSLRVATHVKQPAAWVQIGTR